MIYVGSGTDVGGGGFSEIEKRQKDWKNRDSESERYSVYKKKKQWYRNRETKDNYLYSFRDKDNNSSFSLSSCPAHSLYKPDGGLGHVEEHDEVDLANIQALLPNTGRDQGVVPPGPESTHWQ